MKREVVIVDRIPIFIPNTNLQFINGSIPKTYEFGVHRTDDRLIQL